MNDNFDLNIEHYTIDELTKLLELPETFSELILKEKINKLTDNIKKNVKLSELKKMNIINFLEKANQLLKNAVKDVVECYTINKQNRIYVNSYRNNYNPGIINQLKKRTIESYICINSLFRDNYYTTSASDYTISLPMKLYNILQIRLTSFKLPYPNSFFNISQKYNNNKFKLILNDESIDIIIIPFGNYDNISIIDSINVNLSTKQAPFNSVTFSIDDVSSKTIIQTNSDPSIKTMSIIFYDDNTDNACGSENLNQKQIGWLLGFKQYEYHDYLIYTSESPVDMKIIKYIYLSLDDGNNNMNDNFIGILKSSILYNNIIARISIDSLNNNQNVVLDNEFGIVAPVRNYFGPVDIQYVKVKLIDEYGICIDLNSMNFSFTLSIVSSYDL